MRNLATLESHVKGAFCLLICMQTFKCTHSNIYYYIIRYVMIISLLSILTNVIMNTNSTKQLIY